MQGIIGETYNRMLAGMEALQNPDSKFYLADDFVFHGKGSEADYALDGYFGETAATMFGKVNPRLLLSIYPMLLRGSCGQVCCCDSAARLLLSEV